MGTRTKKKPVAKEPVKPSASEARAILQQAVMQRVGKCKADVERVLADNDCTIVVQTVITGGVVQQLWAIQPRQAE